MKKILANLSNSYVKEGILVITAIIIIFSGFFVFNGALADTHTATVTVDKTFVKTGTETYKFNITNNGADSVKIIQITAPSTFTINDVLVCPSEWLPLLNNSSSVACAANELLENYLVSDNSAQISFLATAPSTDGVYNWEVKTKDVLNIWDTKNPTTIIDNTTPVISINPITTPTTVASQSVTGTFTETNIDNIKVNGVGAAISGNTYSATITLSEGSNTVTAVATDKVGLTGSASQVVVLDTIPPITSDNGSDNWTKGDEAGNVTITLTAIDGPSGSGVAHTYYTTDGSIPTASNSYSGPFTITTEGPHQLMYYSVDNAGNTEEVKPGHIVKIDKTKPTTTYSINPEIPNGNEGWYIINAPTITLSCSDQAELSGCEGVYYKWGSGEFTPYTAPFSAPQGYKTLNYYSKDKAGNTADPLSVNIKTDTINPTISDNAPTMWKNINVTVTLNPIDYESGIGPVLYCEGSGCVPSDPLGPPYQLNYSTQGQTIVRYWTIDTAGNTSTIKEYIIKIDTTPPAAGVFGQPTNWAKTDQTASVTCTDAGGSDCDTSSYKLQVSISPLISCSVNVSDYTVVSPATVSQHSWVCSYVKDIAGNEDFSDTVAEFKVDKIAPTGNLTGVPSIWQNTDASIGLTGSDTGDSTLVGQFLNIVTYGATCNATTPYTVAILVNQHSTACWKLVDGAGNITQGSSEIKVDKTIPTNNITLPEAGSWQSTGFTVTLNYSDEGGSGLKDCKYKVESNGVITEHYKSAGTCTGNIASLTELITVGPGLNCPDEGTNKCTVFIHAFDNATNESIEFSRSFSIDWTPPIANISSPTNGDIIRSSNVPVTFTTDGTISPISQCFYQIDENGRQEIPTCTSLYTITNAPDGKHNFKLIAKDSAGNEADSNTVNLLIDIDKTFTVGTTGADFTTIQDAINAADDTGYKIFIKNGHYDLVATLNLAKKLTIQGQSQLGVQIDASSVAGYGITNNDGVNDITLEDFTLIGSTTDVDTSYGIKATHTNNLTVKNVTVKGSGRSEVDLNTVTTATLENVTADGNNTKGVGVAVSASSGITLKNITTTGNIWGGVGLYDTSSGTTSNVTFTGTNSFGETNPIYIDAESGHVISNITLPSGFGYAVRNTAFRPEGPARSDDFTFYQYSQENAINFALTLQTAPFTVNSASSIQTVASGGTLQNNFIIGNGMSIQTAITAAASGATINVAAGTYTEQININKSLTLSGAGMANTHIESPTPASMTIYDSFGSKSATSRYNGHRAADIPVVRITASNVTLEKFHIDLKNYAFWDVRGSYGVNYSRGVGILVDHVETVLGTPDVFSGITIQNNKVDGLLLGDKGDGIKVLGSATATVTGNTIYCYGESGINVQAVDGPVRGQYYPTVTANSNTIYLGGPSGGPFGIGFWSGATGSADGNTIYNDPVNDGYALNVWGFRPVSFTNNTVNNVGGVVGGLGAQLIESTNIVFTNNMIENQALAGAITHNPTATITGNTIINCTDGFVVDEQTSGAVTMHNNSFEGIASGHYAVKVGGTAGVDSGTDWGTWSGPSTITIDATKNWWGNASGPQHSSNPGGIGDNVSNYVNFRPWYTNADLTGLDETRPTVAISSTVSSPTKITPIPITVTFSESVFDFTANDNDIVVTNGTKGAFSGSGSIYTIDVIPTADGAVTVDIAANVDWDASGNYNTAATQFSITFDTIAPTATFVSETLPPALTNSMTTDITVAGVDVTYYKYKLDSASYSSETPVATHITLSGLADGPHTLSVIGRDVAGNLQAEGTATIHSWTIDKTAPTVTLTKDHSDLIVKDADTVVITATFNESMTSATTISINVAVGTDADIVSATMIGGDTVWTYSWDVPAGHDGNATVTVAGTDLAGNAYIGTNSIVFIIDNIVPTVVSHVPSINAVNVTPSVVINITFNEGVVVEQADVNFNPTISGFSIGGSGTSAVNITPTSSLTDNTIYTITLSGITDLAGNALPSYHWSFTTATIYSVNLYSNAGGWNLISLPVVPNDTRIATVLGGAVSNIDAVWAYAPEDSNAVDGWLVYVPGDPERTNNLEVMTAGYGYWISARANALISGSGSLMPVGPTLPPSRTLKPGWNLVGYYQIPGTETSVPLTAFTSLKNVLGQRYWTSLWGFNNQTGSFTSVSSISPGNAFWMSLGPDKDQYFYTPSNE